jgi:Cleft lip and palate transmembrane protein 1 (CLPTM1)
MQKSYGLDSGDMDEMKRMFLETDPILLSVTMIVSLLHTIFEVLAFKNDIHFWKTKDSMEGISVRTLYTQTICSVIIFLYLCDNDTSFMILFSSGFSILLDFWKIKKASKVKKIDKFPYFELEDNQNYV